MTKIKNLKLILSLSLVLLLAFSLIFPAHAAVSSPWYGKMTSFPTIYQSSYYPALAGVVQKYLYSFNYNTRSTIANAGGVDGAFGFGTTTALIDYQEARGLANDGLCGPATWTEMANGMSTVGNSYTADFLSASPCVFRGQYIMLGESGGTSISYYFYNEANTLQTTHRFVR